MHPLYSIPMFLTTACVAGFGLFVLFQRPSATSNRLFCLTALSVAWWTFGYGLLFCSTDPVKALACGRLAYLGVCFIPVFFYHFMLAFLELPRGFLLWFLYALATFFLWLTGRDIFMNGVYVYFWGYYPKAGPLYWTFPIFFYGAFLASLIAMAKVYRVLQKGPRPGPSLMQVKYVLIAYFVATLSVSDFLPKYHIQVYPFAYLAATGWLAIMVYACFRFRVMEINVVVRRTLVYSIVTATLTMIYVAVIFATAHWVERLSGKPGLWIALGTALFTTLAFHPLWQRVQRLVDSHFFRSRTDREAKLAEFSAIVLRQDDTAQVLGSLCRVVDETFHPEWVALFTRDQDRSIFTRIHDHGNALAVFEVSRRMNWMEELEAGKACSQAALDESGDHEAAVLVPLLDQSELSGFLAVGKKRSQTPYEPDDIVLLRVLVNQTALALERPKLLDEFSGAFTHEIKTPLTGISLPAELTYLEVGDVQSGKRTFDEVAPKIRQRMQFIMDQARLAGQRLEAIRELMGTASDVHETFEVNGLVERALDSMEELIQRAMAKIEWHPQGTLGSVKGNARQLEIVLVNLLKNALEALEDQSPAERRILVEGQAMDDKISLKVIDSGKGISEENQSRLFKSFFTTKGKQGTGMGLFLSRQIVKAHGGSIDVRNHPGRGVEFEICLPRYIRA